MTINNDIYFALVEEQLAANGQVKIPLVGTSMQPTLCPGDLLTLASLSSDPQIGDVVLFRYHGHHLLHRIVAIDGDCYTMRGDNCINNETATRENIVARLVAVKKKNLLRHWAVRWLGSKGRRQLRPWYFAGLAILMWAPLNGIGIPLNNFVLGLRMDHLLHASVFIPCAFFLWDLFRKESTGTPLPKYAVWASAVAIGLLTESIQGLLPYRGFDINDMVANTLGVTLGWLAILYVKHKTSKKRQ